MNSFDETWWYTFFNNPDYLQIYGDTVDEHRTETELQFCVEALAWTQNHLILDGPCGQGRHTRRLREGGYQVIGLDISPYLLRTAREELRAAGSPDSVAVVRGHLGHIPLQDSCVDFSISMFSSFGYGKTENENLAILSEYARVLRPGGKVLIDVMNRHFIARFLSPVYRHEERGLAVREEREIVEGGRRLINNITVVAPNGETRCYPYKPWLYNGWEISLIAQHAGLRPVKVYGDFNGADYSLESERAMLVAEKPA